MTDPRTWDHAACRDLHPHVFFPPEGTHTNVLAANRAAIAICEECRHVAECLAYALANREEHGIWGASTPSQRRMMLVTARRYRAIDAEIIATIGRMRSAAG